MSVVTTQALSLASDSSAASSPGPSSSRGWAGSRGSRRRRKSRSMKLSLAPASTRGNDEDAQTNAGKTRIHRVDAAAKRLQLWHRRNRRAGGNDRRRAVIDLDQLHAVTPLE